MLTNPNPCTEISLEQSEVDELSKRLAENYQALQRFFAVPNEIRQRKVRDAALQNEENTNE